MDNNTKQYETRKTEDHILQEQESGIGNILHLSTQESFIWYKRPETSIYVNFKES